ncbi:hypothetical protein UCDDS831_g06238 [Diplodia seriata]|uniref:Uncharacterized protein n=1 Tax=Diplodia seriata TaxID=420778 RepID=A0A0G2E532_9PEZI|nr:hypothetical protein UCDDS831_g06238 [Diplodia seriata]
MLWPGRRRGRHPQHFDVHGSHHEHYCIGCIVDSDQLHFAHEYDEHAELVDLVDLFVAHYYQLPNDFGHVCIGRVHDLRSRVIHHCPIVGISVASVSAVVLAAGVLFLLACLRKRDRKKEEEAEASEKQGRSKFALTPPSHDNVAMSPSALAQFPSPPRNRRDPRNGAGVGTGGITIPQVRVVDPSPPRSQRAPTPLENIGLAITEDSPVASPASFASSRTVSQLLPDKPEPVHPRKPEPVPKSPVPTSAPFIEKRKKRESSMSQNTVFEEDTAVRKPMYPLCDDGSVEDKSPISDIKYPKVPRASNQAVPRTSPNAGSHRTGTPSPRVQQQHQQHAAADGGGDGSSAAAADGSPKGGLQARRRPGREGNGLLIIDSGAPSANASPGNSRRTTPTEKVGGRSPHTPQGQIIRTDGTVPADRHHHDPDQARKSSAALPDAQQQAGQHANWPSYEGGGQGDVAIKTPMWAPRLTPTRRGDDLYLAVAYASKEGISG